MSQVVLALRWVLVVQVFGLAALPLCTRLLRHLPEGTRITNPQGGFVLWVELPRGVDALELLNRSLAEGISLTPGMMFSATRKFRNFVRVSCGHPWDRRIENAVVRLGELVRELSADSI